MGKGSGRERKGRWVDFVCGFSIFSVYFFFIKGYFSGCFGGFGTFYFKGDRKGREYCLWGLFFDIRRIRNFVRFY